MVAFHRITLPPVLILITIREAAIPNGYFAAVAGLYPQLAAFFIASIPSSTMI